MLLNANLFLLFLYSSINFALQPNTDYRVLYLRFSILYYYHYTACDKNILFCQSIIFSK